MKSLEICSWQHLWSSNSRRSTSTTPYLLVNLIGKDGKTKEVAKAQMHLVGGLFEEKSIPPIYACIKVEQLLKSSYEDNEIDIPTVDGKNYLGDTILWRKRDIVLVGPVPLAAPDRISLEPQQQQD